MKPALALVALFISACGDSTALGPVASVRFLNATPGLTGNGAFTTNGQFASGSALAFGQSACSQVAAGVTAFGFGAANTAGTALSGNALATLNDQSIMEGGNFIVAAAGSATTPTLFLLDNAFSGSLGANQAAVRFVNLAPGTEATANTFVVFTGVLGQGGTLTATDIVAGAPTAFSTVTSGSNAFTILQGHNVVVSGPAAVHVLQAGSVNTLAIIPNTTGGFQLINLPRC